MTAELNRYYARLQRAMWEAEQRIYSRDDMRVRSFHESYRRAADHLQRRYDDARSELLEFEDRLIREGFAGMSPTGVMTVYPGGQRDDEKWWKRARKDG